MNEKEYAFWDSHWYFSITHFRVNPQRSFETWRKYNFRHKKYQCDLLGLKKNVTLVFS